MQDCAVLEGNYVILYIQVLVIHTIYLDILEQLLIFIAGGAESGQALARFFFTSCRLRFHSLSRFTSHHAKQKELFAQSRRIFGNSVNSSVILSLSPSKKLPPCKARKG